MTDAPITREQIERILAADPFPNCDGTLPWLDLQAVIWPITNGQLRQVLTLAAAGLDAQAARSAIEHLDVSDQRVVTGEMIESIRVAGRLERNHVMLHWRTGGIDRFDAVLDVARAGLQENRTAAVERARAEERERCAALCDAEGVHWHSAGDADLTEYGKGSKTAARQLAKAIRALGPTSDAVAVDNAPTPLTRCQAASLRNDGECHHRQCPVPGDITIARLHCTLPGGGNDLVDEDNLPPAAPAQDARAAAIEECARWHDRQAALIRDQTAPLTGRQIDAIGDHDDAAHSIRAIAKKEG